MPRKQNEEHGEERFRTEWMLGVKVLTLWRGLAKQFRQIIEPTPDEFRAFEWVGKIEADALYKGSPRAFIVKLGDEFVIVFCAKLSKDVGAHYWKTLPKIYIK